MFSIIVGSLRTESIEDDIVWDFSVILPDKVAKFFNELSNSDLKSQKFSFTGRSKRGAARAEDDCDESVND